MVSGYALSALTHHGSRLRSAPGSHAQGQLGYGAVSHRGKNGTTAPRGNGHCGQMSNDARTTVVSHDVPGRSARSGKVNARLDIVVLAIQLYVPYLECHDALRLLPESRLHFAQNRLQVGEDTHHACKKHLHFRRAAASWRHHVSARSPPMAPQEWDRREPWACAGSSFGTLVPGRRPSPWGC